MANADRIFELLYEGMNGGSLAKQPTLADPDNSRGGQGQTGKQLQLVKKLAETSFDAGVFEEGFLRHWEWRDLLRICDKAWSQTMSPKDIINMMREPAEYDEQAKAALDAYYEEMKYDFGPICGCICFEGHVLVCISLPAYSGDASLIDPRGHYSTRALTRHKKPCLVIWQMRDDFSFNTDADEGYACNWRHPYAVLNDQGKPYFKHPVRTPKAYRSDSSIYSECGLRLAHAHSNEAGIT